MRCEHCRCLCGLLCSTGLQLTSQDQDKSWGVNRRERAENEGHGKDRREGEALEARVSRSPRLLLPSSQLALVPTMLVTPPPSFIVLVITAVTKHLITFSWSIKSQAKFNTVNISKCSGG